MPTTTRTPYPAEWFHWQDAHTPTWYTDEEVADIERRAAKRGDTLTDEQIGHGRAGVTILKACADCGELWAPQFGAKTCARCRAAKANTARWNGKAAGR